MLNSSSLYEMTFAGSRIIPIQRFLSRADALVVVRFTQLEKTGLEEKLHSLVKTKLGRPYRLAKFFGQQTRATF